MVKPKTKKILITIGTLFLLGVSTFIFNFKINHDYRFAKSLNMPAHAQNVFWNHDVMKADFGERVGVYNYHEVGGFVRFNLDLNDQCKATYSYNPWPGDEDVFEIVISEKVDNGYRGFAFYVNQKDLKIIKDDSKHRIQGSTSPEERIKIDKQTMPDDITNTDELEKLAIKRFKEAQDKYYKNKFSQISHLIY